LAALQRQRAGSAIRVEAMVAKDGDDSGFYPRTRRVAFWALATTTGGLKPARS